MGSCISTNHILQTYIQANILPYPGTKVYVSTLFVKWVWEKDSNTIIEYINEYDPMYLKSIHTNTTRTLDCIARFRRSKGLPFLLDEERRRYDCLIQARDKGNIGGYPIVRVSSKYGVTEYLDNCKYMG